MNYDTGMTCEEALNYINEKGGLVRAFYPLLYLFLKKQKMEYFIHFLFNYF